jgi:hypothetical protein
MVIAGFGAFHVLPDAHVHRDRDAHNYQGAQAQDQEPPDHPHD